MRYLFAGAQETVGTAETQYYHGDLIRSTMLTTDETGAPSLPGVGDGVLAYTAFGEILDASGSPGGDPPAGFPRYQYAGAWGYETGGFGDDPGGPAGRSHLLALYGVNPNLPPITLQHVGWRWYEPDIGRFVQRDPIGIRGGFNVYAYCSSSPLVWVDPDGLVEWVKNGPWWARWYLNVTGGRKTDVPAIIDDTIENFLNGKGGGALGAGTVTGHALNYKYKLGIGRGLNVFGVCLAGAWIGWNTGKIIVRGGSARGGSGGGGMTPPSFCFAENTVVATTEGLIPISSIAPGYEVSVGDSASEGCAKVTAVVVGHARELVEVSLPQESLLCTPKHPFFVVRRGWVNAGKLHPGWCLLARDGTRIAIQAVHRIVTETPVRVYTLDVDGPEVFYVGVSSVRVHNKNIHY